MNLTNRPPKPFYAALLLIGSVCLLDACISFCPGLGLSRELCTMLQMAKPRMPGGTPGTKLFESPGTLVAYHGTGCAQSNQSGREDVIQVVQSIRLPDYVTQATVFLNGWHVRYLHTDNHVRALGTVIDSIRLVGNTLSWRAAGALSDSDFEDAYEWCYQYTVIGWNQNTINLVLDQHDDNCDSPPASVGTYFLANNDTSAVYANGTTTGLASFPSFLFNRAFADSKAVAILPRGFGFMWSRCGDDHHLLQLSLNMSHSEVFIQDGRYHKMTGLLTHVSSPPASQVETGYVSWNTDVIFKDNDVHRGYYFAEMVSGLGGRDLGLIDPPFQALPINKVTTGSIFSGTGQISSPIAVRKKTVTIRHIPYNYALPVLTGWDLYYSNGGETIDHHVRQSGIWLDNIHYQKDSLAASGTLTYDLLSILTDDDNNDFTARHKVTVLGFQASDGQGQRGK